MLAFLEEYSEVHFCEEEQYMKYYGYPEYALHKEKHENFVTELHFLNEELRNIRALGLKGSYELSVETVQVVVDWLHDHVMTYDRKLGEFLCQHAYLNIDVITSRCRDEERFAGGILTICSICHKLCGKKGPWKHKEHFGEIRSEILYSHGICPECLHVYYADLFRENSIVHG